MLVCWGIVYCVGMLGMVYCSGMLGYDVMVYCEVMLLILISS